jgi:hypothetical protein
MALNIDTTKAVIRPSDQQALVRAVFAADPNDEREYIEWKCGTDLATREGRVNTARTIIGFANRRVEEAAKFFEGRAYLLLGVEPESVCGTPPMDPAKIDDALQPYLGGDGPTWSVSPVTFQGAQILLFAVEPPQWGDRLHTLRRGYNQYQDGDIFVRRQGKTLRASTAEIRYLEERARRAASLIDVTVVLVEPSRIALVEPMDDYIESWIDQQREHFLSPLYEHRQQDWARGALGIRVPLPALTGLGDRRSPNEYAAEVERYLSAYKKALPDLVCAAAAARGLGRVGLKVINPSDHNVSGVEVRLDFDEAVAFDPDDELDRPDPPTRWASFELMHPRLSHIPRVWANRDYLEIDTHRKHVRFPNVHMRPLHDQELDPISLFTGAHHRGQTLSVRWMATSSEMSGQARGSLSIDVETDPIPTAALLEAIGREEDD